MPRLDTGKGDGGEGEACVVWSVDSNARREYENEVRIKHVIPFTGNSKTRWEEKLREKSVDSTWPTKATYAEA